MSRWHWLVVGAVLGLAGCSRPPQAQRRAVEAPVPPAAVPPLVATTRQLPTTKSAPGSPRPGEPRITWNAETGVLSGRVVWDGPVPADPFAGNPGDRTISVGGQKVPAQPTRLLRVQNQGVADAVVWLMNPPPEPLRTLTEPVTLMQRKGDYQPHIEVVPKGTRLRLATSDDQADFRASGAADFSVNISKGKLVTRPLKHAGLVEIHSEVHPWMSAYLWVFEHHFHARTNADGEFRLPTVPAGTYQVMVWHEGWRVLDAARYVVAPPVRKQIDVKLGPNQGASIQFSLSDRDALAKGAVK